MVMAFMPTMMILVNKFPQNASHSHRRLCCASFNSNFCVFSPHLGRIYRSDVEHIRIPGVNRVEEWNALWEGTGLYSILTSFLFFPSLMIGIFSAISLFPFLLGLKTILEISTMGWISIYCNWLRTLSVVVIGLEYLCWLFLFICPLLSYLIPSLLLFSLIINIFRAQM